MSKINIESKNVPDLYQVKCREKGTTNPWCYGIVDQYSKEAKKTWKVNGNIIVEDAITSDRHQLSLKIWEIVPIEFGRPGANEYDEFVNAQFDKTYNASLKVKKGLVGKMIKMGVGDGHAFYVVTKETAKTATIDWRGFSMDRWVDRVLRWGGTFPKKMIANLVD